MDLDEEALLDPHPDVHALFVYYNELYFGSELGACSVQWSSARMTRCGGTTSYTRAGGCIIKLSEPILKFRPAKDLKEVLLHEMIHAFLMLRHIRDGPDGHGPQFQAKMRSINEASCPDTQRPLEGYNISVFHTMIAEVRNYQTHHWKCTRCGRMVMRAMNRPPQEADCRGRMGKGQSCTDAKCAYHMHIRHCGGAYEKVAEPPGFAERQAKKENQRKATGQSPVFHNGAALPAKRCKSNAGKGMLPITDFFKAVSGTGDAMAPLMGLTGEQGAGNCSALESPGSWRMLGSAGPSTSPRADGLDGSDVLAARQQACAAAALRRMQDAAHPSDAGQRSGHGPGKVKASSQNSPQGDALPKLACGGNAPQQVPLSECDGFDSDIVDLT